MADSVDSSVADRPIDEGIAKLTSGRIEETIRQVLHRETGARLRAYVGTSMRCGVWAEACHACMSRGASTELAAIRARICVTACHTCHSGSEDVTGQYEQDMHTTFLTELLVKCVEKPAPEGD